MKIVQPLPTSTRLLKQINNRLPVFKNLFFVYLR